MTIGNSNKTYLTLAVVVGLCFGAAQMASAAIIVGTDTYRAYDTSREGGGFTLGSGQISPFAATFGAITEQDPDAGVGETTSLYDFRGLTSAAATLGDSYFFLEDVHDGQFDSLGVTIAGLQPRTDNGRNGSQSSGGNADSVDEDDGVADGLYGNPRSGFRITSGEIRFTFDEIALGGQLPTHVGLVFAERTAANFTFSAYDSSDNLLDTTGTVNLAYADPFLGIINEEGISYVIATGEAEYDHFQYGFAAAAVPLSTPEPGTVGLLAIGIVIMQAVRTRKVRFCD